MVTRSVWRHPIRRYCEAHHLSLADVARRIGASSRNAYARYEHGTSVPKLDTVQESLKAVRSSSVNP